MATVCQIIKQLMQQDLLPPKEKENVEEKGIPPLEMMH